MLRYEFSPASDIYALGVTILYALTGRYAHAGESRAEFTENLRSIPATIPENISQPWRSLLPRLLQMEPTYRLTAEQIEVCLRSEGAELPPLPELATITVATEGQCDCSSIREAIDRAVPGTRIVVRPGKYRESLRIDKPVELVGDGRVEEVIVSVRDGHCLELAAAGPGMVRGLTLRCRPGADGRESY